MPVGTAHKGKGARGLLEYALEKDEERAAPEIVGGTMDGTTARELAAEFAYTRQMRPDIQSPIHHLTLSGCPGEEIGAEKWAAIAAKHLQNLGYDLDKTQFVVIQHHDTEHEHWSREVDGQSKNG
jgi:hypothetical protein